MIPCKKALGRFGKGSREGAAGSRWRGSPAASQRWGNRKRRSGRTSGHLRRGSGWSEALTPRAPAIGGEQRR